MEAESPLAMTLLAVLAKGGVLLAVAGLVVLCLRRASAAWRHGVWAAAMVGLIVLPVVGVSGLRWDVPVPAARGVVWTEWTGPVGGGARFEAAPAADGAVEAVAGVEAADVVPVRRDAAVVARPVDWMAVLGLVWLVGCLVSIAPYGVALLRLRRMRRHAGRVDLAVAEIVAREARRLGVRRTLHTFMYTRADMPMTWGVWRPVLLLPHDAARWCGDTLRAVVRHELAHVKRLDFAAQLTAQLACALHWPNPLAWYAAYRMRVERERACDDMVLQDGMTPSDYAAHLVSVARGGRRTWALHAAVAMAHGTRLEGRVRYLLDAARSRASVTRRWVAGVVACAVTISGMIAAAGFAAREAEAIEPAPPAEDLQPTVPTPQAEMHDEVGDEPLPSSVIASFPGIGHAELVGIGDFATDDGRWYTPAWEPLDEAAVIDPQTGKLRIGEDDTENTVWSFDVRFRFDGPGGNADMRVFPSGSMGKSVEPVDPAGRTYARMGVEVPRDQQTVDIAVAMTNSDWKLIASGEGDGTTAAGGHDGDILFLTPEASDRDVTFTVISNRNQAFEAERFTAVDKNGQEHEGHCYSRTAAGDLLHAAITVPNLSIEDTAEVRYYIRQYQWVLLRNVPLSKEATGHTSVSNPMTIDELERALKDEPASDRFLYDRILEQRPSLRAR